MRTRMPLAFSCYLLSGLAQDQPITLDVDATDAARRIFHAHMTMPVKPGPFTLLYPKWIPGEHMPSGPITNLVGLKIKWAGNVIPWRRDSAEMFAFHLDVPAGVAAIDVDYDFLGSAEGGAFSSGSSSTTELAVLNWNQLLLYPEGADPDHASYRATLKVPTGWRYGTALPIARESGNFIEFKPAPLTTLVDSPVSAGKHYRTVDLGSDLGAAHYVNIAADSDRALEVTPETVQHWKNAVAETGALYGSRHYRSYHFLFTLSDHIERFGLEHHESSDDRDYERTLVDPSLLKVDATLLPHEMTHSWNGKFRRPDGLGKSGYDNPMKGDMLWVYEGLTNYLGEVLAARSGLWTAEEYREGLAMTAAHLDGQSGRAWRPLEDTAVGAQLLYVAPADYSDYRRSTDYYAEGSLIWLEADVIIRRMSNGAKSLNDFCRAFHGGPGGAPEVKSYTFDDVVTGLKSVQPYDWAGFFEKRLRSTDSHAPLGGVTGGGWKLVFNGTRSELWKAHEEASKDSDLSYSIGLRVKDDGTVKDVALKGPAFKSGVSPSGKLTAVNNRQFSLTVLRDTVERSAAATGPIELLIKYGEYYRTFSIDYHGGERYPHLEREAAAPDLISAITTPIAKRKQP